MFLFGSAWRELSCTGGRGHMYGSSFKILQRVNKTTFLESSGVFFSNWTLNSTILTCLVRHLTLKRSKPKKAVNFFFVFVFLVYLVS